MIGITGGIGSGKSVVSRILRLRGLPVYDCDLEAKRIMDSSEEVLRALNERFGDEVCPAAGPICRPMLARHVFGDDEVRLWLNSLVHRLVRDDVAAWSRRMEAAGCSRCFVESAILASSGLAAMCDEIWLVTAPESERVARVASRDAADPDHIRRRIIAQKEEENLLRASGICIIAVDNSAMSSLLDQLPAPKIQAFKKTHLMHPAPSKILNSKFLIFNSMRFLAFSLLAAFIVAAAYGDSAICRPIAPEVLTVTEHDSISSAPGWRSDSPMMSPAPCS